MGYDETASEKSLNKIECYACNIHEKSNLSYAKVTKIIKCVKKWVVRLYTQITQQENSYLHGNNIHQHIQRFAGGHGKWKLKN